MTGRVRAFLVAGLGLSLAACSQSATELSINVTAGQETDAFTATPPVATVKVEVTSLDGTVDLSVLKAPGESFDLGTVGNDAQITVAVTGTDASGNVVMKGQTLSGIALDAVSGGIPVFAQRVDSWARPPGNLTGGHLNGAGAVFSERYLVLSGGSASSKIDPTSADAYDLGVLGQAGLSSFPITPATMVSLGATVLLVGDAGQGAAYIDSDGNTTTVTTLPDNLTSFDDVAGGQTVVATDKTYVVGATRGQASATVLEVDDDGSLVAFTLAHPRTGAAATFITDVGLVVVGGSADGAGVELLRTDATSFGVTGFAPDPTVGAGAATDGTGGVLLIGGLLPDGSAQHTRRLDPSCVATTTSCAAAAIAGADLPVALTGVVAYSLGAGRTIAIGSEATGMGMTRSFIIDVSGGSAVVTEVPLREPRRGATPVPAPNGSLALLGGVKADGSPALSVEMFFPR